MREKKITVYFKYALKLVSMGVMTTYSKGGKKCRLNRSNPKSLIAQNIQIKL